MPSEKKKQQVRVATVLTRRKAMLDAAIDVFVEKGYERTSLNDIIERSKGSFSTLYSQFGSKEGLLRAMIEETCAWPSIENGKHQIVSLEKELFDVSIQFVRNALTPRMLAVYRIVITENHLLPDLAKFFFETGPKLVKQKISEHLRGVMPENKTGLTYEELANIFIGALIGDLHFRYSLGIYPSSTKNIEQHVHNVVRFFVQRF